MSVLYRIIPGKDGIPTMPTPKTNRRPPEPDLETLLFQFTNDPAADRELLRQVLTLDRVGRRRLARVLPAVQGPLYNAAWHDLNSAVKLEAVIRHQVQLLAKIRARALRKLAAKSS